MVVADTSESRPDAGAGMVEAGEYHWVIEEVNAETSDFGTSLKVVSSVLAGTTPGQTGKKQTEFFQCSGKAVDRLRRLLVATQIMTDEEWVARIGQPLEFDERLLKGRQFCARIKMDPYRGNKEEHKGKHFPAMNFDIWSIWDEKAKHIPKDPEMLSLLGSPPAAAPQPMQVAPQPQSQQAQPQQQPPTSQPQPSQFSW